MIDTAHKRFSMMQHVFPIPIILVIPPDGSVDDDDRFMLLGLYSGIVLSDGIADPLEADDVNYLTIEKPPNEGLLSVSGDIVGPYDPSATAFTLIENRRYFLPIKIAYITQLSDFGIYVTTADASQNPNVSLAIWPIELGVVKDAIYTNTLFINATGFIEVSAPVSLSRGVYMFSLLGRTGGTMGACRQITDNGDRVLPHSDESLTSTVLGLIEDIDAGDLADIFDGTDLTHGTLSDDVSGTIPRVYARIA